MKNEDDPKGLIREAYRIDGITLAECRSIFLDWALSLPAEADTTPDHPMTAVLAEGKTTLTTPRRRGGWRSRPRN